MLNKFLSFKVHNKFKNVAHVMNIAIVEHWWLYRFLFEVNHWDWHNRTGPVLNKNKLLETYMVWVLLRFQAAGVNFTMHFFEVYWNLCILICMIFLTLWKQYFGDIVLHTVCQGNYLGQLYFIMQIRADFTETIDGYMYVYRGRGGDDT